MTVGKIVDYGLKDSQNMGACMAPAACDTIIQNLEDFERKEEDYDRIITGDLGYVGQSILFDLMREKEYDIKERHMDCGMTIFDQSRQDTMREEVAADVLQQRYRRISCLPLQAVSGRGYCSFRQEH